jgi:excinuclease ABC subunit C
MKGLFRRQAFTGFGACGLHPEAGPPPAVQLRARRPGRLRALVREHCPRHPGVYGMVDVNSELVYVGKAKCLRTRLLSYFRPNSRDPKAGRILEATRLLVWEPGTSEFAALLRELELIRRWRPRFNVQGQPRRHRRVYVCVGRRPAPYVFLTSRPPATALAVFGPVPASPRAGEAVRRVNDLFRLRDCPQAQEMAFAEDQELFPVLRTAGCLRHEIGSCLGPCAAACTRADYGAAFRAAVRFLQGKDASPVETLQSAIRAASEALEYERALVLHERLETLRWLCEHLGHVREWRQHSFVYPVTGQDGRELWYLIHHGRVCAALPAPADNATRRTATMVLEATYGKEAPPGPPTLEEIDGVLLVASWFRRHKDERARTHTPAEAKRVADGYPE